jgi:TRAP-type C4-dicarboxylate transport system substrate-binding protein
MKRILLIAVMVLCAGGLVSGNGGQGAALAADQITLNLVTFDQKANPGVRLWLPLFVDKVNERAKGKLIINWRGGPEVIPPFDQGKALSKGAIDMAFVSSTFYQPVVPGADSMRFSSITRAEEREKGAYALSKEIHAKAGIYFLGSTMNMRENFYYTALRKPVQKKEDFQGLKLAGSPAFLPCFKALGAAPVTASLKEYYSAAETGVTDGNMVGLDVYMAIAEYEVAPYVIDHPYYKSTNNVIVNLQKWNALPDDVKKILEEAQVESENAFPDLWAAELAKMKKTAIEGKAKFNKLPPDVAKWYLDTFYNAGWKWQEENFPPDVVVKFKKLISK